MGEGWSEPSDVGREFVRALSAKDSASIVSLLDAQIDFRGLTPNHEWRAESPDDVLEILFGSWFEPTDHIREVSSSFSRSTRARRRSRSRVFSSM